MPRLFSRYHLSTPLIPLLYKDKICVIPFPGPGVDTQIFVKPEIIVQSKVKEISIKLNVATRFQALSILAMTLFDDEFGSAIYFDNDGCRCSREIVGWKQIDVEMKTLRIILFIEFLCETTSFPYLATFSDGHTNSGKSFALSQFKLICNNNLECDYTLDLENTGESIGFHKSVLAASSAKWDSVFKSENTKSRCPLNISSLTAMKLIENFLYYGEILEGNVYTLPTFSECKEIFRFAKYFKIKPLKRVILEILHYKLLHCAFESQRELENFLLLVLPFVECGTGSRDFDSDVMVLAVLVRMELPACNGFCNIESSKLDIFTGELLVKQ